MEIGLFCSLPPYCFVLVMVLVTFSSHVYRKLWRTTGML